MNLIWVFHHLAQLPSHFCQIPNQPMQSQANSGTLEIQINKTQCSLTWDTLYVMVDVILADLVSVSRA